MADPNEILPEFTVSTTRDAPTFFQSNYFDLDNFRNQNLLRSCKFALRMDRHPGILSDYSNSDLKQFTFLCDSIEFPGRSLTTTDFNIPGRQKIRTPYKREFNEITMTFYHNTKFPIYQYFTNWLDEISPNTTSNRYFDSIVTNLMLFQFYDTAANTPLSGGFGGSRDHVKYPEMMIPIYDAYPVTVSSLPSNWADDGFHKITATFFYEYTGSTLGSSSRFARSGSLADLLLGTRALDDYLRGEAADELGSQARTDFFNNLEPPKINFGD